MNEFFSIQMKQEAIVMFYDSLLFDNKRRKRLIFHRTTKRLSNNSHTEI